MLAHVLALILERAEEEMQCPSRVRLRVRVVHRRGLVLRRRVDVGEVHQDEVLLDREISFAQEVYEETNGAVVGVSPPDGAHAQGDHDEERGVPVQRGPISTQTQQELLLQCQVRRVRRAAEGELAVLSVRLLRVLVVHLQYYRQLTCRAFLRCNA